MGNCVFDKAREWICLNARPLDRERFRFLFENGRREAVLSALAEYQNEDGGFGHALEADSFNPNSAPIQTWTATEILHEIALEEDHPIVRGILAYLDSGSHFNGKCWLYTVPSNNDYPRASWWTYDSRTHDDINYNPTAALAGFALMFADKDSGLFKKCFGIAKEAIRCLKETDKCDEMHTLACYVKLAECCRRAESAGHGQGAESAGHSSKAGLADELDIAELEQILVERIKKVMTWDTESWKTKYVCKPSNFFMSRDSYLYKSFAELAEQECSFIKEAQQPDGTWSVNWNWEDYEEQWHIAKTWWKAQIIIMNLRFLKGMTGALYGGK